MADYDSEKEECRGCHSYFYIEQMDKSGTLCKSCAKHPKDAYKKEY